MATGVRTAARGNGISAVQEAQAATLYLALFLALLAFFLFLTSLATFDPARTVSVIESVEARFAEGLNPADGPQVLAPHFAGPAGMRIVADEAYMAAAADAFAALDVARDDAPRADGVAWHGLRVPAAALFVGNTAALTPAARAALAGAASAMTEAGDVSATRRMDIAVGGAGDLVRRRAAALAAETSRMTGPAPVAVRTVPDASSVSFVFYAAGRDGGR